MKNNLFTVFAGIIFIFAIGGNAIAQEETKDPEGYQFKIVKELPTTSVKNQYRSGTCWSFSSLSFVESELLRMDKGEYDLSEMFVVWHTYSDKAKKYVRFHGELNFGGGGAFHDVMYVLKEYGMVPEEVYDGKVIGEENHIHGELDAVAKGYVDAVLKNKNRKLSPVWHKGFEGILNAYLGDYPSSFTYKGKDYTPRSFADELGINPDDYVEIGSYTHHPFYSKFVIEVPDNWMFDEIYNVPLDEMMEIIDYSINNGFSVGWGSDVSEKGFSWKNGVAVVPDEELTDLSGTEKEKWEKLTDKEKKDALYSFEEPVKEKTITQEIRQAEYDNYKTTDDHGMLITGIANDQGNNIYYKVKNSWGNTDHKFQWYTHYHKFRQALQPGNQKVVK